jgi:Tfp pilus assembly protein PilO
MAISGSTSVALSLVVSLAVSLVAGAFAVGGERQQSEQVKADVAALKVELRTSVAVQNAQALELVALKTELRAIRESQQRMEATLDRALGPPLRPPVRTLSRASASVSPP